MTESFLDSTHPQWGIDVSENDIVEYNGISWVIAFDASENTTVQFVTNSFTGQQFKWTGTQWISSWQGVYNPGYWRLLL